MTADEVKVEDKIATWGIPPSDFIGLFNYLCYHNNKAIFLVSIRNVEFSPTYPHPI